jgi:hypothetical protein
MLLNAFIALVSGISIAAPSGGCFETHLKEALAINHAREAKYEAITSGRSKKVSESLMSLENRMLIYQRGMNYDRMSQKFDRDGIHVTCDSVVTMANIQEFRGHFAVPTHPVRSQADEVHPSDLPRLIAAYTAGDDAKLRATLHEILERLARQPHTDCLYRHFLESMQRISALQPRHEAMAARKGLPSPGYIHRRMLFGHMLFLPTVVAIDAEARPFNLAGVPIICDDIPKIPLP